MKLKLIACGVFRGVLERLAKESPNAIHIEYLEANLHAVPDTLHRKVTEAIGRSEGMGYDAVLLAYGLCNKGVVGLVPRETPLVLPRAHDCITLFLGSMKRYREEFAKAPGTFYFSQCWIDNKGGPRAKREQRRRHPQFQQFVEKYGRENADYIFDFYESWRKNYQRAVFIHQETDRPQVREDLLPGVRALAESSGWRIEEIQGDLALLRDLMAGRWDEDRFLVVRPGQKTVFSSEGNVVAAVAVGAPAIAPAPDADVPPPAAAFDAEDRVVGLGIDAGGTYTDAALYDFANDKVLSKAKALTTKHDLTEGIVAAVAGLDASLFEKIRFVAISTTLATNAVVEGKTLTVGLLVLPPPGFRPEEIPHEPKAILTGLMGMDGNVVVPLDEDEVRRAARRLAKEEKAQAIAVSGFAGISNPLHELEVKRIVREECDLPILCGHELSMGLNFLRRANTAVLNAQLMPLVAELMDSVKRSLRERGIVAPLLVVKGDGTLMGESMARDRPIETVLSGPAASVVGAVNLARIRDAMVIDMGGTTSDVARVREGEVVVNPTGARVGGWETNVRAADIQTSGLGGDSYVQIIRGNELSVGPKRVIPIAYLAHKHPRVVEELRALRTPQGLQDGCVQPADFFAFVRDDGGGMEEEEREIVHIVREGPASRLALARELRLVHPLLLPTERLERRGVLQRSALTPTDVLHVTGEFRAWDAEAAAAALDVFAARLGVARDTLAERILRQVRRQIVLQLLLREFSYVRGVGEVRGCAVCEALIENLLAQGKGWDFSSRISLKYPIVAIGAPVRAYFEEIGDLLGTTVVIPDHAEVANALGAVMANVVIEEEISIRPTPEGSFVLHSSREKREFDGLTPAKSYAARQVEEIVSARGAAAGAGRARVEVRVRDRLGSAADGSGVLIETVVRGRIAGKPRIG